MRTFPPEFETSRRNGSAPVWLLRFTAGGTDYVLCQDAVTIAPWGLTAQPWIASWGNMSQGVTGTLDDFRISDLTINLINDPDAAPALRSRAKSKQLHGISVSVYFWYDGCAAAPFEMARYRVRDIDLPDEVFVNLELQDESIRYENYYPGTIVTRAEFPFADPDDVGKTIPMPVGMIDASLTLALDAGVRTSLTSNISASMLSFEVGDTTGFFHGTLIMIDDEGMEITDVSGDIITVLRGVGGTQAINHQRGAAVWEQRDEFIYAAAAYPVDSLGKVFSRLGDKKLNVTPIAQKYTGKPGNEHPALPGMAVIVLPGYITVRQAVALLAYNHTLDTIDGTQLVDRLGLIDYLTVSGGYTYTEAISLIDQLGLTDGYTYGENIRLIDALTLISGGKEWSAGGLSYSDSGHGHTGSASTVNVFSGTPVLKAQGAGAATISVSAPPAGTTQVIYAVTIDVSGAKNITITVPGGSWYLDTQVGSTWRNINVTAYITGNASSGSISVSVGSWATVSNGYIELTSAQRTVTAGAATSSNSSNISKNSGTDLSSTGTPAALAVNVPNATGSTRIYRDPTSGLTQSGSPTNFTKPVNNRVVRTPAVGSGLTQNGYAPKIDQAVNNRIVRDTGTIAKADVNAKWSTLTGNVALSGNSVANTLIGEAILVDIDHSSVTAPQDVIGMVLGLPCQVIGSFPSGYAFNGQINSKRRALEWCHDLARQCRSYFTWRLGQPTLIVRPDVLTPVKTISEVRLSNGRMIHGQKLTDINDVINTINLQYDRDWSGSSADSYRQVASGTSAPSIAAYGVRERPELFKFDFVTSPAMAASVVSFYLSWYAWQRWRHTQEVYLFEAALEFADAVTLGYLGGEIGEVAEVGFSPGNGRNIDKIQLTVIE